MLGVSQSSWSSGQGRGMSLMVITGASCHLERSLLGGFVQFYFGGE